jgi:serine/threonine-protein kinase SRPK3
MTNFIDSSFFDDEGIADYRPGVYFPIKLKEVLNDQYEVIDKLGWGHYSTVWLCRNRIPKYKNGRDKYVALKIVKSSPNYTKGLNNFNY